MTLQCYRMKITLYYYMVGTTLNFNIEIVMGIMVYI